MDVQHSLPQVYHFLHSVQSHDDGGGGGGATGAGSDWPESVARAAANLMFLWPPLVLLLLLAWAGACIAGTGKFLLLLLPLLLTWAGACIAGEAPLLLPGVQLDVLAPPEVLPALAETGGAIPTPQVLCCSMSWRSGTLLFARTLPRASMAAKLLLASEVLAGEPPAAALLVAAEALLVAAEVAGSLVLVDAVEGVVALYIFLESAASRLRSARSCC